MATKRTTRSLVLELVGRGWEIRWVHGTDPHRGCLELEGPEQELPFDDVETAVAQLDEEVTP